MSVTFADTMQCPSPVVNTGWNQIVEQSLPTVRYLASRLASRLPSHVDIEDLVQVGIVGLLQSASRFDPERGYKFQTYASRRVQGAMLDYLRSLDWRPRSIRQKNRQMDKAQDAIEKRLGRNVTSEEMAEEMGVAVEDIQDWQNESSAEGDPLSIRTWGTESETSHKDTLESIADPSDSPEILAHTHEMEEILTHAIESLPDNEKVVIRLHYKEEVPMHEIGKVLGVKQGRVSQLHGQAVRRLRKRVGSPIRPSIAA